MAMRVGAHPYGDRAFDVLAQAIRTAKDTDPLSPVTVVVDRGSLGLAVRRQLAATPPGVIHLRAVPWKQLAAELATPWMTSRERTLASPAVELEAVRSALAAETPPHLAGALGQPATLRALARTYRDLSAVPDRALDALASQSPRTADVVQVLRKVRSALSDCVTPAQLLEAATAEVRRAPEWAAGLCGTVVVFLPRGMGTPELALLDALGECTDVEVIVGTTGDVHADGPARELVTRLSSAAGGAGGTPVRWHESAAPVATWVRSAPSADAEVLMAVRHLMGRNAEGVPFERMALLHSGATPYRQLVHDVIARAQIPAYGGSVRPLSATVAGRTLAGALALADHDWRRDDVVAWLASAPLLHGGRLVPAAEWDALSIEAGVVSGLDQWRERLGSHAASLREDARTRGGSSGVGHGGAGATGDTGGAGGAGGAGDTGDTGDEEGASDEDHRTRRTSRRLELDARRCDELRAFLDAVAERLGQSPGSWSAWGAWAKSLLSDLLGPPTRRATWHAADVVAFDAVTEALGRLGALDWVGGAPPAALDFGTALAAELDAPAPQIARSGRGLLVGRVTEAVGLDLDVVCVVGMVDGAFPSSPGDDVLVPDRERERAGAEVPLRAGDAADGRRDYLAALASARERVVSCARYDQRHGRELRPARLLLESLEALAADGRRLSARELRDGPPPALGGVPFQFVASFADAVRDGTGSADAISDADWRLRSVARWVADGRWASDHFLASDDAVLGRAIDVRRARRSRRFTRFDGLVERLEIPSPANGAVQSATGLESYARCPRRYYFSHLLKVTARELPETVLQLSPAERGVIIHRVLERLVADEIASTRAGAAGSGEDPSSREARMLAYAEEEFEEARKRGVTGHPALWELERSRMTSDLREHLRVEAEYRTANGATPVAVEMAFGPAAGTRAVVDTRAGPVAFRGRIDRIDELRGGAVAVVDYKSGKRYDKKPDGDPLSAGERLQLPVYALAAKAAYGAERKVHAAYWFVGSPTLPDWLALDDEVTERLAEVVGIVSDGIETGRFPGRPGASDGRTGRTGRGVNCTYCPYDDMCPVDRGTGWRRKRSDPALEQYVALTGET